jgi:hypothetical protein
MEETLRCCKDSNDMLKEKIIDQKNSGLRFAPES